MLRIYRVIGGLLGAVAVWTAALRSSVAPAQHLAILLVRSVLIRCHIVTPVKTSCINTFQKGHLLCLRAAGPLFSRALVWYILGNHPGVWCGHFSDST